MASVGVILLTAGPEAGLSRDGAMVKVDGRESLLRCVERFVNREGVAQVVCVFDPDVAEEAKRKLASHLMILGVKLAVGGPTWREQIRAGLEKLPPDVTHVLVHDGARPAISPVDLDKLLDGAEGTQAAAFVCRVPGQIAHVDESGRIAEVVPGRSRRLLVTPQLFALAVAREVADKGYESVWSRVTPVESSPLNVRVNGSGDASLAKALLALLPKPKVKGPLNPFEEAQW